MKYNTGRSSYQISAAERFDFGEAHHRDIPTAKQKKFWGFLMCRCKEHGVSLEGLMIKLDTRADYTRAIDMVLDRLAKEGVLDKRDNWYNKRRQDWYEKMRQERKNTAWISMKKKRPDRKYVKTLDEDGTMHTLEWNSTYNVFVSPQGMAITKKNEAIHAYKVPIAWAYLED